jgi:hypothetical protein
MTITILIVPLIAIAIGLLVYFGCSNDRNKQAEVGRCVFFAGLLILLWILTFHGRL